MEYESRRFELLAIYKHDGEVNGHKPTSFNGPPRPELEAEWEKLMERKKQGFSFTYKTCSRWL